MAPESPQPGSRSAGRRLLGGVAAAVVAVVAVFALVAFLNARDDPGVGGAAGGADVAADPPGVPLEGSGVRVGAAQEELLQAGNVILLYGSAQPPAALRQVQDALSGPPDAALEAAGQAVVLQRRAGVDGAVALAWRRALEAPDPADPQVEAFAAHWLGRGAAR